MVKSQGYPGILTHISPGYLGICKSGPELPSPPQPKLVTKASESTYISGNVRPPDLPGEFNPPPPGKLQKCLRVLRSLKKSAKLVTKACESTYVSGNVRLSDYPGNLTPPPGKLQKRLKVLRSLKKSVLDTVNFIIKTPC